MSHVTNRVQRVFCDRKIVSQMYVGKLSRKVGDQLLTFMIQNVKFQPLHMKLRSRFYSIVKEPMRAEACFWTLMAR